MFWNSRSHALPRQAMPSAAQKLHLSKMKDPLWPAIPARITIEDPPLLAQVCHHHSNTLNFCHRL